MELESTILRSLAVIALAGALITLGYISVHSGVVGGSSSGSVQAATSASQPGTPQTGAAAGGLEAGDASAVEPQSGQTQSGSGGTTTGSSTYIVQDGDSFFSIARKYNTSIAEIQKLNPNVDPQHLTTGVQLVVP